MRRLFYFPYASEAGDAAATDALIMTGARVPDCLVSRKDRMSGWSDEHLLQHLRSLWDLPEGALDIPALMQLAIERFRLDVELYEQYEFHPGPFLSNLLIALGGRSNRGVSPDEIIKWATHAEHFDSKILPSDHFFIRSQLGALARIVVTAAETVCRTRQAYESKVML